MKDSIVKLLASEWLYSGLHVGDTVLLHSDLKRLLREYKRLGYNLEIKNILDSLLYAVGPEGTVVLPLFNFDFTRGVAFDIRTTPSQMGALSEAARLHPEAIRSGHPIYSFAAIGFHSPRFKGLVNYSGYGADSPFGLLRELDGKVAVLNLPDQKSMTFYHHVEEMVGVPYRYHKIFTGQYTDEFNFTSYRDFSLFVRDLTRGVVTDVNRMGEFLWGRGLYKGNRHGVGFGCRSIDAKILFNATAEVIRAGRAIEMLYSVDGD